MDDIILNELQITVMDLYKFNKNQVNEFNMQKLMTLIEGKDMTIYNQFKLKLRNNGYII